jgi:hypothetical protein
MGGDALPAFQKQVGQFTRGYISGDNNVPIAFDPNDPRQMSRNVQKYGTVAPKGYDLPKVRMPGVDLDPRDFAYNGTNQGQWNGMAANAMGEAAGYRTAGDWERQNQMLAQGQQNGLAGVGGAIAMYRDMAMGQGPNLAGAQMRQGLDQSIAAQLGAANSLNGGATQQAAAVRQAQLAGDQMRSNAVNQSAPLAAQQQLAGIQGYGNMGQAYGNLAGAYAQQYGQQSAADLAAAMQARGQQYDLAKGLWGYGTTAADRDMQGRMAYGMGQAGFDLDTQKTNIGIERGIAQGEMALGGQIAGGILSGLGGLAGGYFGKGK